MTAPNSANSVRIEAQAVAAPLTRAAIFLVLKMKSGDDNRDIIRSFCSDLSAVFRAVDFRDFEGGLSVIEAHAVAVSAEHALIHAVPRLAAAVVHADPLDDADHHALLADHALI